MSDAVETAAILPANMPDFGKVAAEYWEKEAAKEDQSTKAAKSSGIAVVTPPVGDALMDGFFAAFDTPVILPVEWPNDVPESHPIRALNVHVRLWDSPQWARFWALNGEVLNEDKTVNEKATREQLKTQFWFVVLVSACDKDGRRIFSAANSELVPVSDEAAIQWLIAKFDGPAGLLTMNPIYVTALGFNGLLRGNEERDAKN